MELYCTNMPRKIIFGIFFSIWLVLIILLSVWPGASVTIQQDVSEFHWDYLEHFLFYFILTFLYIFWRFDHKLQISGIEIILFLIAGLIFSWLVEYIQVFIPGRAFTLNDMISNMAGILFGILINYYLIVRLFLKKYFHHLFFII